MQNVIIVSTETIKPSSATPESHRTMKLCFLDSLVPFTYSPLIFFYTKSSKELGTVRTATQTGEKFCVDCNDEGAELKEARVDGDLLAFLESPPVNQLRKLLPCDPLCAGATILKVQINRFSCGGTALGICMNHVVGDMVSQTHFMNYWAEITRGDQGRFTVVAPRFDWRSSFSTSAVRTVFEPPPPEECTPPVTKVFTFETERLATLRGHSKEAPATRFEAVMALLWRCFIRVRSLKVETGGTWMAGIVVNIRDKMEPKAPVGSFGNLVLLADALAHGGVAEPPDRLQLQRCLRGAIEKMNSDYLRAVLKSPQILDKSNRAILERALKGYAFGCSSYCNFPLYESDFGWGKPAWVSSVGGYVMDFVVLIDSPSRSGIQAWVNLDEKEMAEFEHDQELLSFVTKKI
ncbi:hypothetical protein AMTR_s00174p00022940 [Amborella trichopoda]|uniref:Uncharacterized protein n=1 Tax=Amborella trichopoda TaxID=13333 RepID=U5CMU7_AMBTC|nr:hypothetical protein AMTR_s00174p00022940 [Amborella trichopoda]